MDDYMDLNELCRLAYMGKAGYRNLRRQGKTPPAFKVGRRLLFKREDVAHWLTTVRIVPVPDHVNHRPAESETGNGTTRRRSTADDDGPLERTGGTPP